MKQGRTSQTALKVALGLITLSIENAWAERLARGLVEITERLLLASGSPGYGPGLMPGQFEAFGHRKIDDRFDRARARKAGPVP
jgi:hypothetical protein